VDIQRRRPQTIPVLDPIFDPFDPLTRGFGAGSQRVPPFARAHNTQYTFRGCIFRSVHYPSPPYLIPETEALLTVRGNQLCGHTIRRERMGLLLKQPLIPSPNNPLSFPSSVTPVQVSETQTVLRVTGLGSPDCCLMGSG